MACEVKYQGKSPEQRLVETRWRWGSQISCAGCSTEKVPRHWWRGQRPRERHKRKHKWIGGRELENEKYDSHIKVADRILAGEGWSSGWTQEERKFVEWYRRLLKAGLRPVEDQQRRFELYEWFLANPPPPMPLLPKSRAIAVAVDAVTAKNARVRPDSIRIATRDESGAWRLRPAKRYAADAASSAVGWIRGDKFIPDEVRKEMEV